MLHGVGLGRGGNRFCGLRGISDQSIERIEASLWLEDEDRCVGTRLTRLPRTRPGAHVEHQLRSSSEGYSH